MNESDVILIISVVLGVLTLGAIAVVLFRNANANAKHKRPHNPSKPSVTSPQTRQEPMVGDNLLVEGLNKRQAYLSDATQVQADGPQQQQTNSVASAAQGSLDMIDSRDFPQLLQLPEQMCNSDLQARIFLHNPATLEVQPNMSKRQSVEVTRRHIQQLLGDLRTNKIVDLGVYVLHDLSGSNKEEIRSNQQEVKVEQQWESFSQSETQKWNHCALVFALANRQGSMTRDKLNNLEKVIGRFCRTNGLIMQICDRDDMINKANLLNEFCEKVDLMVRLFITNKQIEQVPRERWQQLAQSEKMVDIPGTGRLGYFARGECLFKLEAVGAIGLATGKSDTKSLCFSVDIPNATEPMKAFDTMAQVAENMAKVLRFHVCDQSGKQLTSHDIAQTRKRIIALVEYMQQHGLRAGSAEVRILFS